MVLIRPARPGELGPLPALLSRAVEHMNASGNPQWGPDYPTPAHYLADAARGELYLALTAEGAIAGAACLNTAEAPEYAPLPWTAPGPAMVVHRMVVDPCCQRQGVGSALFAYAEALARRRSLSSLRVDTYSLNAPMLSLIAGRGFRQVGVVHFDREGRPLGFLCFEKRLSPDGENGKISAL